MSDYKLISPLLDGFVMGDPISTHNGVACCPAMRENTDEKYIVKVVSVPASQKELDALLLTGAYPDAASAAVYFKEQAEGVIKESELLQQLSRLEGFLPYSGCQIVPMENNELGYEVYLISPYKRSLEKHLRRNTMTHLGAVNLGLDLCAALAICRRAGYLYVAGKPTNIFIVNDREFRIGDLGFVPLGSLKYSSLPAKYCSCYSPPELHDAFATLNPTADTYAVGMMLYRIYNNGVLPFAEKAPLRTLPAPANADYEMAEIILKAIAPNPRNRYQTPIEMGKALVSYMQRNIVNDVPIVPPTGTVAPENVEEAPVPQEMPALEITPAGEEAETAEPVSQEEPANTRMPNIQPDEVDLLLSEANGLLASNDFGEPEEEPEKPAQTQEPSVEPDCADEAEPPAEEESPAEEEPESLAEYDEDEDEDDEEEDFDPVPTPGAADGSGKKKKKPLLSLLIVLLIAALVCGGYYFYNHYYLLPIDSMNISTQKDTLTVEIKSDIDESMLTIVCTDTYGNTFSQKVSGGKAVFTGLNSDTLYKVNATVSGFHKLTGAYFGSCTTPVQARILNFEAKTGTENGSAILSFTVEGAKGQDWIIEYSTPGEEKRSVSLSGHMTSVNDLTIGSVYTFTLLPASNTDQYFVGENTLQFTASKNVVAQDLRIVSYENGVLTAQWTAGSDTNVESWNVRCYSEGGYDRTIEVTDTTAQFTDISSDMAYTVEVTAAGMSQNVRAFVSANPTAITDITVTDSAAEGLQVNWTHSGATPEGGWLVIYSIDGSEASDVVKSDSCSAAISTWIPGASYNLTIQAADGSTVFGGEYVYQIPAAKAFDQYSFQAGKLQVSLCKTPAKENWTHKDVAAGDYTTTFEAGASASMVIYSEVSFYLPSDQMRILYVIRDSEGKAIAGLSRTEVKLWNTMWNGRYSVLTIPAMPTQPGSYSVSVYFNGGAVTEKDFTITG